MVSCIITGSNNTFKYASDGLRRQKTTNSVTTDYAYDGSMMVREGHASGGTLSSLTATYLVGARGPECRVDETQPSGEGYYFGGTQFNPAPLRSRAVTKWYVFDGLGSVVGEVDPSGNLTSSPKYDVYGAVRGNAGTASTKQGFVGSLGHLSEPETGLVYMSARYMDPNTGRFQSEDPAGSGINWFAYCSNNPTNLHDPSGREGESLVGSLTTMAIGGLLGAISGFSYSLFSQLTAKGKIDPMLLLKDTCGGLILGMAGGIGVVLTEGTALEEVFSVLATVVSPDKLAASMAGAAGLGAIGGIGRGIMDLDAHNTQVGFMLMSLDD